MLRTSIEQTSVGRVEVDYYECDTCARKEAVDSIGRWLEVVVVGPAVGYGDEDRHYCSDKCLAAYYEPGVENPAPGVVGLRP